MFRRMGVSLLVAVSLGGCSLFVSLDDLNDGGSNADAGTDAAPNFDARPNDASLVDASDSDAGDSGSYFVVDTCVADSADVVSLTTAGTTDWVHYGTSSDSDQKNVTQHVIGALLQSSNGGFPYDDDSRKFSWTDGTSFPTISNATSGQFDLTGPMVISVDANPQRRVLTVYLGTFTIDANVAFGLSPGPAASSQTIPGSADQAQAFRCSVHFASAVPAELTMTFSILDQIDAGSDGPGNLAFLSATVSPDP